MIAGVAGTPGWREPSGAAAAPEAGAQAFELPVQADASRRDERGENGERGAADPGRAQDESLMAWLGSGSGETTAQARAETAGTGEVDTAAAGGARDPRGSLGGRGVGARRGGPGPGGAGGATGVPAAASAAVGGAARAGGPQPGGVQGSGAEAGAAAAAEDAGAKVEQADAPEGDEERASTAASEGASRAQAAAKRTQRAPRIGRERVEPAAGAESVTLAAGAKSPGATPALMADAPPGVPGGVAVPVAPGGAADAAPEAAPEAQEAAPLAQIDEDADAIIRLRDGDAGPLEVRVRLSGSDLFVRVRAEEATMRDRMLSSLSQVEQALEKERLVTGRVSVTEQPADPSGSGSEREGRQSAHERPETTEAAPQRSPRRSEIRTGPGRLHVLA